MKDIAQLIGHTFGVAYLDIHVVMGVTINPEIDTAILDIFFKFHNEGSVGLAIGKLGTGSRLPLAPYNMPPSEESWPTM